MSNNYNLIAPIYELLTRIIFLGKIQKSQTTHLKYLPNEGNILFIGGGSGKTLKELVRLKPELNIDYIDKSDKMIALSKKKLGRNTTHNVNFIHGTESDIPEPKYDVIITFFFLDLFQAKHQSQVFSILDHKLVRAGTWLVADFNPPTNFAQLILARIMYLFLKWTTRIESHKIIAIKSLFNSNTYKLESTHSFYSKLIFSNRYTKVDSE